VGMLQWYRNGQTENLASQALRCVLPLATVKLLVGLRFSVHGEPE